MAQDSRAGALPSPAKDQSDDLRHSDAGEQGCGNGEVTIRTHKGSGKRKITLELLKQVGHLPQQKAADQLNVGNTRFKTATRELGMRAWPYRKIKSIRNLISVVESNPEQFEGQAGNFLEILRALEEQTFQSPTTPLEHTFKKFRQAAYKLKHKARISKPSQTS